MFQIKCKKVYVPELRIKFTFFSLNLKLQDYICGLDLNNQVFLCAVPMFKPVRFSVSCSLIKGSSFWFHSSGLKLEFQGFWFNNDEFLEIWDYTYMPLLMPGGFLIKLKQNLLFLYEHWQLDIIGISWFNYNWKIKVSSMGILKMCAKVLGVQHYHGRAIF